MAIKVYIVYYSNNGHVEQLAQEIKKGADSVEGVEGKSWRVPETLSAETLGKLVAPSKSDVPVITPDELTEADGLIFSFPTRFGMMAAQFKAFLDSTGGLWIDSRHSAFSSWHDFCANWVHSHSRNFEMEKVKGGSPYGAGTYAGDGSRQTSELELEITFHQGKYFSGIAKKLKNTT